MERFIVAAIMRRHGFMLAADALASGAIPWRDALLIDWRNYDRRISP